MSRKALFFDVDGTLLSEITRTVPESAVRALSETRKKGNLVFINSGRVWCHLGEIKHLVEADGYLCGCGTNILAEGKEIYHHVIPHERGLEIKKAMYQYGVEGFLEGKEGIVIHEGEFRIRAAKGLRAVLTNAGVVMPYRWNDDSYDFDKFCMYADENSDREGFFQFLKPDMDVIDRGGDFYECVPAGHSKATAIEMVLKAYGLEKKDAYVFGDSSNDLAMFEYADNAVLMGHHDAVLEPYASFVTRTVEEDGVEYAMRALKLL